MDIQEFSRGQLKKTKGILLYGAGAWGKLVAETLQGWMEEQDKNIPIIFIDRLKTNQDGIKVIKKDEIDNFPGYDILICAPSSYKEIIEELSKLGEEYTKHIFGIAEIVRQPEPKTYVNVHDCLSGKLLLEKYIYYRDRKQQSICGGGRRESGITFFVSFSDRKVFLKM